MWKEGKVDSDKRRWMNCDIGKEWKKWILDGGEVPDETQEEDENLEILQRFSKDFE